MNYKLHPPINASQNRFLDFKIYVDEVRRERIPLYKKSRVIGHTDGKKVVTVKRIIGFGATEAAARSMVRV